LFRVGLSAAIFPAKPRQGRIFATIPNAEERNDSKLKKQNHPNPPNLREKKQKKQFSKTTFTAHCKIV